MSITCPNQLAVYNAYKRMSIDDRYYITQLNDHIDVQHSIVHGYVPELSVSELVIALDELRCYYTVMYDSELVELINPL